MRETRVTEPPMTHRNSRLHPYRKFAADGMGRGHRDDFYDLWEQAYLGTEGFVQEVERPIRERPPTRRAGSMEKIPCLVVEEFGCSVGQMRAPGQQRVATCARSWVTVFAVEVAGHRIKAVARALGRSPGSLSMGLGRLQRSLLEEPREVERLKRLAGALRRRARPKYGRRIVLAVRPLGF